MNNLLIAAAVAALIYVVFKKLNTNIPKIEKIEEKKKVLIDKVEKLEAERETLKDKAVSQEKDASEKHKEEFWEEHLGKKKDDK